MTQPKLNLGILAHVDAGKTTLTERLLHAAGVIDAMGSVDRGTTQTDTLALERSRGITIRSAVVSFEIDGVAVNLIDTPGHPDFIAEVERALRVLDGAVLVVSAVEGVQAQTRLLMRALQRLSVPALIFVNKIDRVGASVDRVLAEIGRRLTPHFVPLATASSLGTRLASVEAVESTDAGYRGALSVALAERDDRILETLVDGGDGVPLTVLRDALVRQTGRGEVYPVLCGSALTGAGIEPLMSAIAGLLPSAPGYADAPVSGLVFKVERSAGGGKVAYARMYTGTLRGRDHVSLGRSRDGKVATIEVFERGKARRRPSLAAGEIGKLYGLKDVRVGDEIGEAGEIRDLHDLHDIRVPGDRVASAVFAPPTLEAVAVATDARQGGRLRAALEELAEQDPLIDVRSTESSGEVRVSLFGEVQREVIEATLADDYGIGVAFEELTPTYAERPVGRGEAAEILNTPSNPFHATVGFRVEPGPPGSTGVEVRFETDPRLMPLYLYKNLGAFKAHMTEWVDGVLDEGLHGWHVTGCVVTMTECGYSVADGPPSRRGPTSTIADFRGLTPMVLMSALERAGTEVLTPVLAVRVECPAECVAAVSAALGKRGASAATTVTDDEGVIEADLAAADAHALERKLRGLTHGEGFMESRFAGYRPVSGEWPCRKRTSVNPLDRAAYLARFSLP